MAVAPVRGVEALDRAFSQAGTQMQRELPKVLRSKARPVERGAEVAASAIGAGKVWSPMRTGASRKAVWVAPVARGTRIERRKRRRFATRLLTLAMEPSLDANRAQVGKGIDELLARIQRQFNRG